MRVTFVLSHAGMSGGHRVLSIYAERLRRRGHEVMVISTPLAKPSLARKLKALVRGRGWLRDPDPEPSWFDGIDVSHHVLETARPVVDDDLPNADVVLATFWVTGYWVAKLSPSKGAKAIMLQGYETSPGREDPAMDAAWRLPLHKIVVSRWLANLARDRFGDSNVHIVPNSVDTAQFWAPVRKKNEVPTVGVVYAPHHLKGMDVSIAALQQARNRLGNLRVIAFGGSRISAEFPLPEWVEFHYRPPQHELRRIYEMCDVWLFAGRREGFGLPLLEAMACRCPVVSTRCGGPLDFVEDGVNGYLADLEDSTGLADRMVTVLTLDQAGWTRMSDAALATATRFTWDNATDLLEGAFREIINTARRGA